MVSPVGLLGSQRKTIPTPGRMASRKPSSSRKPSASRSRYRSTVQPTASSAASYSAKAGAVTSARPGRRASAARQIKSAAPLPHSTHSAGTPSACPMASDRARQRGSG